MKRLFALMLLLALVIPLRALSEPADDQYVRIYNVIQEGDLLNNTTQYAKAVAKYNEAQASLERFKKIYPQWNPKVVTFRLNYLASRIATVTPKIPAAAAPRPAVAAGTNGANRPKGGAAATTDSKALDGAVNTLQGQIRQLQADKILLEAKLKESLNAVPAPTEARDLAKAQERIKSLEKETELLKVDLTQAKTPPSSGKGLDQTQQALSDANRKLAEQKQRADALSVEKAALQNKLNAVLAQSPDPAAVAAARKALEETTRQLAQQKEAAAKASSERDALQAKVQALTADAEAAAALKLENSILKKDLSDLRASAASPSRMAETTKQLAQAQAQIAALLSDKEILHLEKVALEERLKRVSAAALAQNSHAPQSRAEDLQKIRNLEKERDELQKRLETANKELTSKGNKNLTARVVEMENEMAVLRARLEVFESRAIPYSAEELALFKRPEMTLTVTEAKNGKRSVKELPAGSATLVADAQRYFNARDYDKAEEKYLQVLKQDNQNVITLANLAEIQLERKRYDDAEKHIKAAVKLDPQDAYSWFVLGQLKFRQEKYDEALDALSQAAKFDANNPQIQNLLGLTLSEKGMRGPAETALRKAIQIDPGYADAHANLAVVYITQTPPLVELARWHYQKALANGLPANSFLESRLNEQKTASR